MIKADRYFLYVADKKVEKILGQISKVDLKKISASIKIDFKAFQASVAAEWEKEGNRVSRLLVAEKFLLDNRRLSNVYDQGHWISGVVQAALIRMEENDEVVVFVTKPDDPTIILGGSSKHLIGNVENESLSFGWSYIDRLLVAIQQHAESQIRPVEESIDCINEDLNTILGGGDQAWCQTLDQFSLKAHGPYTAIRYFARVLFSGKNNGRNICLATPLYVEQFSRS